MKDVKESNMVDRPQNKKELEYVRNKEILAVKQGHYQREIAKVS